MNPNSTEQVKKMCIYTIDSMSTCNTVQGVMSQCFHDEHVLIKSTYCLKQDILGFLSRDKKQFASSYKLPHTSFHSRIYLFKGKGIKRKHITGNKRTRNWPSILWGLWQAKVLPTFQQVLGPLLGPKVMSIGWIRKRRPLVCLNSAFYTKSPFFVPLRPVGTSICQPS